ncbi:hypothetical protein PFISCL1PPCAC_12531, partial [Pristionchus fissidentatus]
AAAAASAAARGDDLGAAAAAVAALQPTTQISSTASSATVSPHTVPPSTAPPITVSPFIRPDPLEEQLKRARCPVCLEDFRDGEDGRLLPRALQCGHLMCLVCIEQLKAGDDQYSRVVCPVCRHKCRSSNLPMIKEVVYFREQSALSAPLLSPIDIDPIREMDYIVKEELGGVSLLTLNGDDYSGKCGAGLFPMLEELNRLLARLPS